MIKVLWVAADNEGDLEDFNGLPIWENLVLVPSAKFRWAPFLDVHGITLKAIKTSTYVGEEDDERIGGAPIEKIGDFEPGEESDAAWSRLITKRRFWNDEWRAEAKSWMAWADGEGEAHPAAEAADDADGEDGTEEPDDTIYEDDEGYLVNADGDYVDEEGDLVDEPVAAAEEPEEPAEPEPPARTRGRGKPAAAKPAAAKPAARASKPAAAARPAGRAAAKPAAAKPAAAATSSRRGKPAAAKPAAATGRGRGKAAKDNEPPF